MKNNYAANSQEYLEAEYSVIPDKFMSKQPAIKGWTEFCDRLPTKEEAIEWGLTFEESNISICLGAASGIIALDFDADDQKTIDIIESILPDSPVERIGSKGWVRFFRYHGEHTDVIKHNGKVILEILSSGKKVTIPPSTHPAGMKYIWKDKALLDVNKEDLPLLPPFLLSHIKSKLKLHIPEIVHTNKGFISGRNNALSSLCGRLIKEGKSIDVAIRTLIEFDRENNKPPLFSDMQEFRHNEPFTNALLFYSSHLTSVNTRRFKDNKEYEIPITASAVNEVHVEEILKKKEQKQGHQKKLSPELPKPMGILSNIMEHILENSFVKQPEFALSAGLVLMSTLVSRKITFSNMSPNLYVLNIAPSGAGKDAPQQSVKEILISLGAESLLGAGDYVSDASLTDSLGIKPVRLDIIDEASGLLKAVTNGGATYNVKMADILCELYTSSNSKFLGRATAEGMKGSCYRPNVNLLTSTTPTGFSQSISTTAIEKGLVGRFLIFYGNPNNPAERVQEFTRLDADTMGKLQYWVDFKPEGSKTMLNMTQDVQELRASNEASRILDAIFRDFDELRRNTDPNSSLLPIIARLFQQTVKIAIVHACSRAVYCVPTIEEEDVTFGYKMALYYFENMKDAVSKYIYVNKNDANLKQILQIIRDAGAEGITKKSLSAKTRFLNRKQRDELIQELNEDELIIANRETRNEKMQLIYRSV